VISLPDWIQRGEPAVAYYPRRRTGMSEAWPVTLKTPTGPDVIVAVAEDGTETRWHARSLTLLGVTCPPYPWLIPADDPRALAARERTDVIRIMSALNRLVDANRPRSTLPTDAIADRLAMIRDGAAMAYDEITAMVAARDA
jgi:hypothetical protein